MTRSGCRDPRELLLEHLDVIDSTARYLGRLHDLQAADVEDFVSHVKLTLIEDDYAVVRAFRGDSTFRTYLNSVVRRQLSKWMRKRFRKRRWQLSATAKRLGLVAMEAERIRRRDAFTFDETYQLVSERVPGRVTRDELAEIVSQLPTRVPTSQVELYEEVRANHPTPETEAAGPEVAERLESLLRDALAELSPRGRLILKLRFVDGLRSSEIAAVLGISRHQEYRLWKRARRRLRRALEEAGYDWDDLRPLLRGAPHLDLDLGSDPRSLGARGTN